MTAKISAANRACLVGFDSGAGIRKGLWSDVLSIADGHPNSGYGLTQKCCSNSVGREFLNARLFVLFNTNFANFARIDTY